jgi:hypothetical protein
MRRIVCLLAALLVLPSLGSDSPKEYDGTTAWDDGLQGTWEAVEGVQVGRQIKCRGAGGACKPSGSASGSTATTAKS